ncbi:MAG: coenzyme F420-0:L-glutamate ligase [Candidatus Paceibacterota bacterium]
MKLKSNSDKKLSVSINGSVFLRYPIKTHIISSTDKILAVVKRYADPHVKKGDVVVISERVIAITQGRSILIEEINPSWWARGLYKFVYKHPGGIGLRSPYTMEMAIQEAGLWRILAAAGVAAVLKPLNIHGVFYHLVGSGVNAIDGPTSYTLPPGNKSVTLGPKEPQKVAEMLSQELETPVVVIDANDYGVRVIAEHGGVNKKLMEKIFADNPMGQAREQTPIVIVRRK